MLVDEGTYDLLFTASIVVLAGGTAALVVIVRAAPQRARSIPSLLDADVAPPPAARGRTGPIARAIAATCSFAGLAALFWLWTGNTRVLVVSDGSHRPLQPRWMREIGDATYGEIGLDRPSDGVWVVNASSRPLELKASGDPDPFAGPSEPVTIAPGTARRPGRDAVLDRLVGVVARPAERREGHDHGSSTRNHRSTRR